MIQIEELGKRAKPEPRRSGNVKIPDKIIKEMRELHASHSISKVLLMIEERYGITVNYQYARRVVHGEIRRNVK